MQLAIGDLAALVGVVALPDDRDLLAARGQMPVDAVEETFVTPSSNHLIDDRREAGVLHRENGLIQSIRRPCSPQNASGLLTDWASRSV
jgi:hypothetical protein